MQPDMTAFRIVMHGDTGSWIAEVGDGHRVCLWPRETAEIAAHYRTTIRALAVSLLLSMVLDTLYEDRKVRFLIPRARRKLAIHPETHPA